MTEQEKKLQLEIWKRLQFGAVQIITIDGIEYAFHLN